MVIDETEFCGAQDRKGAEYPARYSGISARYLRAGRGPESRRSCSDRQTILSSHRRIESTDLRAMSTSNADFGAAFDPRRSARLQARPVRPSALAGSRLRAPLAPPGRGGTARAAPAAAPAGPPGAPPEPVPPAGTVVDVFRDWDVPTAREAIRLYEELVLSLPPSLQPSVPTDAGVQAAQRAPEYVNAVVALARGKQRTKKLRAAEKAFRDFYLIRGLRASLASGPGPNFLSSIATAAAEVEIRYRDSVAANVAAALRHVEAAQETAAPGSDFSGSGGGPISASAPISGGHRGHEGGSAPPTGGLDSPLVVAEEGGHTRDPAEVGRGPHAAPAEVARAAAGAGFVGGVGGVSGVGLDGAPITPAARAASEGFLEAQRELLHADPAGNRPGQPHGTPYDQAYGQAARFGPGPPESGRFAGVPPAAGPPESGRFAGVPPAAGLGAHVSFADPFAGATVGFGTGVRGTTATDGFGTGDHGVMRSAAPGQHPPQPHHAIPGGFGHPGGAGVGAPPAASRGAHGSFVDPGGAGHPEGAGVGVPPAASRGAHGSFVDPFFPRRDPGYPIPDPVTGEDPYYEIAHAGRPVGAHLPRPAAGLSVDDISRAGQWGQPAALHAYLRPSTGDALRDMPRVAFLLAGGNEPDPVVAARAHDVGGRYAALPEANVEGASIEPDRRHLHQALLDCRALIEVRAEPGAGDLRHLAMMMDVVDVRSGRAGSMADRLLPAALKDERAFADALRISRPAAFRAIALASMSADGRDCEALQGFVTRLLQLARMFAATPGVDQKKTFDLFKRRLLTEAQTCRNAGLAPALPYQLLGEVVAAPAGDSAPLQHQLREAIAELKRARSDASGAATRNQQPKGPVAQTQGGDGADRTKRQRQAQGQKVCWQFRDTGRCGRENCPFSHELAAPAAPPSAAPAAPPA